MMNGALIREAAAYFLFSRVLLFVLLIAGSQLSFLGKVYSGSVWETRITLQAERTVPELIRVAMVGDAWFYRDIALQGYGTDAGPRMAFFPLFPLLVRWVGVSGEFAIDGMVISSLAFGVAIYLLGAILLNCGFARDDASRAMFYLAFFPTSYFGSLPVTEGLFLALSFGAMLAGLNRRWWLAGLLGALGALTRAPGVLILLPLTFLTLERRERPTPAMSFMLLVPAALSVYMGYLFVRTGDAFAFVHAQAHWGRLEQPGWVPLFEFLRNPSVLSVPWNLIVLNLGAAVLFVCAAVWSAKERLWSFASYSIASVLLPLSTGSVQSLARYALAAFPIFAFLAVVGRNRTIEKLIAAVLVTLYGVLIALMVLRVDFALA